MKKLLPILLLIFSCEEVLDPDTTAPTVVITYPVNSSTLTETTTVTVDVADDGEIGIVKLLVDGNETYADTTAPYQFVWDVCVQSTGTHTLMAKTEDGAGNQGQSDLLTYTIDASYDCKNVCAGDATEDNCGTCDSDSSNDCVQDCAGTWDGTSWMSNCGCVSATNSGNDCDDCNGTPYGTAFIDNCEDCVGGSSNDLPCYELIDSENFTASNQELSSYSDDWYYEESFFEKINISDNKLVIKGVDNGYAHKIYNFANYPSKLIDKFELTVDIGLTAYSSDGSNVYGLFFQSPDEKTYYFHVNTQSDGILYWSLSYYNSSLSNWNTIYDWEELSIATLDISNMNFRFYYNDPTLHGSLGGNFIFNYTLPNLECNVSGIYHDEDAEIWVDNLTLYGRQAPRDDLGRYSINDLPKISPILPYNP